VSSEKAGGGVAREREVRPAGLSVAVRNHLDTSLALVAGLAWILLFTTGRASRIPIAAVLALCGFVAIRQARREVAGLAFTTAVAALAAVPPLLRLWPAPLILALATGLGVTRLRAPWLERGEFGLAVAAWAAGVVAVSAGALVAWWWVVRPDLADVPLPVGLHPALLAVGFVGWAVLNAAAEEFYFRGALQHELVRALGRGGVVVQAVAFGFLHFHGFPGGWSGVALATIFGLMTGALRWRAGGLLAPWVAHLGADLTIAVIRLTLGG
jgi:membrane protease YdiL (CAAX protease family)